MRQHLLLLLLNMQVVVSKELAKKTWKIEEYHGEANIFIE
jgi:hypothetical protein